MLKYLLLLDIICILIALFSKNKSVGKYVSIFMLFLLMLFFAGHMFLNYKCDLSSQADVVFDLTYKWNMFAVLFHKFIMLFPICCVVKESLND